MKYNKKLFFALVFIFFFEMFFTGTTRVRAGEDAWPVGPEVKGDGAIVVDAETGNILYEKNIYEQFYPASTTKILTTLVALENGRLDDVLTVSYAADNYVSKTSSRMGLTEGEQVTVEQALYGIMLESGNEATYAVGEHVGKSIAGFIKLMNKKAKALGCDRSHFANSHGLHDDEHYTCCYDMSLIARAAYKNEDFMKITGTAFYNMPATNKHEAKILTNHHWFLNGTQKYEYCIGGKTGATTQAGYALVTYARKDGKTLISVVMHAPTWADVYADSKRLLDYCFDNFVSYKMEDLGDGSTDFPSCFDDEDSFKIPEEPFITISGAGSVMVPEGYDVSKAKKTIKYNTGMELEHGENTIGSIEYTGGERVLGSADIIVYNSDYPITEKVFNERWPSYMIPIDTAFEGVDPSKLNKPGIKDEELKKQKLLKENAVAIGIGAGVLVFMVGGIIAVIKKKRRRR
ncbi:MAG: D-alanyl-D-alanine carboxypeptidase [Lachnospiraceae bacterium]|nr:D-alanyl-D-alanine carboxypeptidase [Lachnospiraceae bacterium]